MEVEAVACDQRVANTKPRKDMVPDIAVPMEEEGLVACLQRVAIIKQCTEMEPEGAVPKAEEVIACAQGMAIAEQCKAMEPIVAVPMEEEAAACDEGVAKAKQDKEMEPKFAVPKEEERVACDQQVAPAMVPLLTPGIAKLCKELDPEAIILENDVYLTIEDCSGELPLPLTAANGDGDGDGNGGKNIVNVITNGSKVTERGLISEPVSEPPLENRVAPEPSWGDVPDEPITVPVANETTPRFPKRQRPAPENVEVDDVVQTMRKILMDLRNVDDARLHPDDDAKVRSLLEYHPQAQEKMGSGIDYIKVKRHSIFKDVRCFYVVRTDGTETDFSYHKCLKEKVAKDHPSFVDRYDAIYRAPKRPRQA